MDARARELVEIGGRLFSEKRAWDTLNQGIAEVFYPERADWTRIFTPSSLIAESLFESTPYLMRRDLANYISQFRDKFSIKTMNEEIDEQDDVARWLEDAGTTLTRALRDRRSQYTKAMKQADHDWVAFGMPVISVEESPTRDHLLFRNWHARDCAIMENSIGEIDTLHRKMEMSARGMLQMFKDKCPPEIRQAAEKEPSKKFKLHHCVMPAEDYDMQSRRRPKKLPFVSLYIDLEHEAILKEDQLPDFLYVVPRWTTVSGYPYGFSPVTMGALPDGRMINALSRMILEAGEKQLDPPMAAMADVLRSDINLYAGGITLVDSDYDESTGSPLRPVQDARDLGIGVELREDVRKLLNDAFFLTKLFLPNEREMSATEAALRNQEFIRVATPLFEPADQEYHAQVLDRAFSALMRTDAFDPRDMPDALSGRTTQFLFENPVKQAEARLKLAAYQETMGVIQGSVQLDQSIVGMFDVHRMTKDAAIGAGAPLDWITSDEAQAEAKQAAAERAQLEQASQLVAGGSQAATQVADATLALRGAGIA